MIHQHRKRPAPALNAGAERASAVGRRIGVGLKESRLALRLSQDEAADRAGISQSTWSRIERGRSAGVRLETLATCAAAVDAQLAGFIEARPGATLPRDVEHLRRQELLISFARSGGWSGRPELMIDPNASRSRAIDVDLVRRGGSEEIVAEIEDLLADGGGAFRNLADKTAAIRRERHPSTTVLGLLIVRATRRNRAIVTEFPALFAARFPGSASGWLRALSDAQAPLPDADGFLWSSVRGDRLFAARLVPAP